VKRLAAPIISIITFVLILLLASWTGAARGGFRIDEAHKISESAFFPLWLHPSDPAWTANITDRSNPPVGKYLFGLAIVLSGQRVPPLPTLSIYAGDGLVPPLFSAELSRPYAHFLPATREVAIICTALVGAIIAWCATRIGGPIGAAIAVALFLTNFLTLTYGATAIFDPILTLFATALLAMASVSAKTRMRFVVLMAAVGVVGALAFQTRLNGLLFFAVTFVVLMTRPDRIIGAAVATIAFLIVTLAVNPYYWPNPITRFRDQVGDLGVLLSRAGGHLTTLGAKSEYSFQVVCGDIAGLLLLFAATAGVATLIVRWRTLPERDRLIGVWSLITVVAFVIWMPVPVPRYLLVTVPPLCCLAAIGYTGAVALVKAAK